MRSTLYVPGDRPDRFDKAHSSGADAIILDLEDSVPPASKAQARANVASWLSAHPTASAWIRVNSDVEFLDDDLEMAHSVPSLGVVMPKATAERCALTRLRVVALVETAAALEQLAHIANVENVWRIGLGEADLVADLGLDPSPDRHELWPIRSQIVVASAAAGLIGPVGPVATEIADLTLLTATSDQLRRQGFTGRSTIHPKQVATVNACFSPTAAQLARARAIVDTFDAAATTGTGVATVDGEFIDEAVARRARSIIAQANR